MGSATQRWHEPCRTQQFALRFADRMLRNLGTPIHCFGQLSRAIFLRSSLTTTTPSAEKSAPSRFLLRRGQASYGVVPKRRGPCANGHMPSLMHTRSNLNQISKKIKRPGKKSGSSRLCPGPWRPWQQEPKQCRSGTARPDER